MKFVFVHQNVPGQFVHVIRHLLRSGHDVVCIGEPNDNVIPGVRRISYRKPKLGAQMPPGDFSDLALALARAEAVAAAAREIKRLGFTPDLIVGHHGWGELLNLQDVWPQAPLVGYFEFFYATSGLDVGFDSEFIEPPGMFPAVRFKNTINLLALNNPGSGLTPTTFQRDTYPAWAREQIRLLPEGVALDLCRPNRSREPTEIAGITIAPSRRLVTFVARDLEPYRGFHVMMRALPAILRAYPDAIAILVGGDGISYGAKLGKGTWRELMLSEVKGRLDLSRVHFPGRIDYATYLRLLQRSDAHIYLSYPFVASWSLREALACGCALIGSDTAPVREFVTHKETGVLTPFLDPGALSDRVREVLEGGVWVEEMRAAARHWAETHLSMDRYLQGFDALITELTGAEPRELRQWG